MTEPSNKTRNTGIGSAPAATDRGFAFNPMHETAFKAWFDMGLEALQFASSGLQKCVEAQSAMMACKTLEDFQKAQANLYTNALEDYRAQVARMMGNISATKVAGLGGAVPKMKRGYDDVPL